jgi:histidinol-phosphate/aromatic aminotransferase/cobyric acid decarboxylase-like protein/adenosyl cobinamide kinase/adenosyl cobinamide phosphate guanylyltransferase
VSLALVLGGVRSGKSARGQELAVASGLPVRYVATADPADASMAQRIAAHAARRPRSWRTVEAGVELGSALADAERECVLLDGLGVWIARAGAEAAAAGVEQLLATAARGRVIVVAEEAGLGLLPREPLARAWLDALGAALQRLAAAAERVELVVAGRPLALPAAAAAAPAGDRQQASVRPAEPASVRPAELASLRRHGDQLVGRGEADHAVTVLDGGPPDWLRIELRAALEGAVERYPDEREACEALAALHGRAPQEVVPANGAAHALWLLPAALRPALAACVHPGFTEGEAALRAHGVPVCRVLRDPERGFALDPGAVPAEADLVLAGNPASPSGTLDPAAALLALRRPGRTVVVDEAYMDLVPGEPESLVRDAPDDVIVVRSLTKSLSLPGVRAGYAVAAPALAERLRSVRPPWSANALALAALTAAARRPQALAAAAERAAAEREHLARGLASIPGVRSWPSVTNFCLIEVRNGARVAAALRARGIAVRPAASFPGLGPDYLRLTARAQPANERLLGALAEVVGARR